MRENKEKSFLGYPIKSYGYFVLGLTILSILASLWFGVVSGFRIVFGAVLTMFVPGFLLSHLFYKKNKLQLIVRIALSFALSLSVIPILIFFLNLAGFPVSSTSTIIIITAVSVLTLLWLGYKKEF